MNGPASRAIPVVVVVLGLAAVMGIATRPTSTTLHAGEVSTAPGTLAVRSVALACPAPGLAGAPTARVALVAAAGSASSGSASSGSASSSTGTSGGGASAAKTGGAGVASVTPLSSAGGTPLEHLTQPGVLTISGAQPAAKVPKHAVVPAAPAGQPASVPTQGGVVIQATGSMASGLEAEQVTSADEAAPCAGPGTDFWFVAPGRLSGNHIELALMNVDSQSVSVNVDAFTDAGPLQGASDTGVTIPPHAMVTQSLDTMLSGSRVVAIDVHATVGQVVAALEEKPGSSQGGAWLPADQAPARQVVVPALPGTTATPQVFVAVPGTQDAHLTVTAVTTKGSYQPTGAGGLDIPGSSATEFPLPSLAGVPGALQISSTVPITATVELPGGGTGAPGVFAGALPPVAEQAVAANNTSGGGTGCEVVLAAPGRAVSAQVSEVGESPGQAGTPVTVHIPAHHALVEALGRSATSNHKDTFAVVVTALAGSGPLYVERVLIGSGRNGLRSLIAVPSAVKTVPLPNVRSVVLTAGN
ncbi:MAG TPA: DUF5719 family protein [Streptosporangiaceae bacterium]|nr:DUF5719 family protein [Streptosporangiaceae bacterium]